MKIVAAVLIVLSSVASIVATMESPTPPLRGVEPRVEMPDRIGYCVALNDYDGTPLGRTDVPLHDLRRKVKRPDGSFEDRAPDVAGFRESIGNSVKVLAAGLNRTDLSSAASLIVFEGEYLFTTEGYINCACATLTCMDPTVCGKACSGKCTNCADCTAVNPGAPIKWRPRK